MVLADVVQAVCDRALHVAHGIILESEVTPARKKVVDAIPKDERRKIAPLRERILVGRPASAAVRASYGEPNAAASRTMQVAFVRGQVICADYINEKGEGATRRVEPPALLIMWPAWYILGFAYLRGEPRTFRFDRFEDVECEEGTSFRARPREIAQPSSVQRVMCRRIRSKPGTGRPCRTSVSDWE